MNDVTYLPNPRVAVYGTLRKGGVNNHVLTKEAAGKHLGSFWTPPDYHMYDLGAYPAITLNGSHSILLEVYEVMYMGPIDTLEGYPDLYLRKAISTPYGPSWVYYMTKEEVNGSPVLSGNWMQHINAGE